MPGRFCLGRTVSLLVVVAVGGCAVGPNFTKPDAVVAENWREKEDTHVATQTAVDAEWWKSFQDGALDKLVDLAYAQNLPLQVAGLRIVEARAQLGIVIGQQFPQVQVATGSVNAIGLTDQQSRVTNLGRNFLTYQLGLDASWELDLWGKYRRGIESGEANLAVTEFDYQSSIVSLSAEVARTYVLMRTYEQLLDQAEQNVKVQEEGFQIAQSRFKNGATSELDPAQAAALMESTRASVPQLQAQVLQARNALSTLLGQPIGAVDALLVGSKGIPKVPERVPVGLPAEILRRRPDVRSAELLAAAQCARIGIAEADLFPSFTLEGTVGLQAANAGPSSRNLFSSQSLFYAAGPRVVWPFLNYGRLQNGVRVEDARFQQLLVNYRNTVLRAAQEADDAMIGFVNAQQALVFSQRSTQAATRAMELSLVQYREGAVDFQRVLEAERSLLQQQGALTDISSSATTSLIALYKALGGGWEVRQGQPVVSPQTQAEMKQRTNWDGALAAPVESPKKSTSEKHQE